MSNLTIILDVDDVLIDTNAILRERINKKYNLNIKETDITNWDLTKLGQYGVEMLSYFKDKNLYDNVKPFKDAIYYTRKLVELGHDIITLSASPIEGYEGKHLLIRKYFPFIKESNIMFGIRKDLVIGDVMLDDKIENIENSKCKYPILFTKPWNKQSNLKLKANSHKEFFNKVLELSNISE